MIVWPEKAHEWVALFAGIFGMTLSITNFVMTHRRDRARLHFAAHDDYGEPPAKRTTIYLYVANIGRRPIRVSAPWIYWRDGRGWPMREAEPVTLAEYGDATFELTHDRRVSEVLAFVVTDSAERDHWYFRSHGLLSRLRVKRLHRVTKGGGS